MRTPSESGFASRLRSAAVAARVGTWLGVCFLVAFVTGLVSHYAQAHSQPVPFPVSPAWGYRITQGVHVAAGTAAVPLLLVKLWTVYPLLFRRLPRGRARALVLEGLERGSIAVLVAAAIFQLATGLANSAQWYPWSFSFRSSHYAVAWVAVGALLVHVAVKLPVVRDAWRTDVDDTAHDRPAAVEAGTLTRRGLLRDDLAGGRGGGGRHRGQRGARAPPCLGARGALGGGARWRADQPVGRGGRRHRGGRRPVVPARGRARRPHACCSAGPTSRRCRRPARCCRSRAWRGGAPPAPGPASACRTCWRWSGPRRTARCTSRRCRRATPSARRPCPRSSRPTRAR